MQPVMQAGQSRTMEYRVGKRTMGVRVRQGAYPAPWTQRVSPRHCFWIVQHTSIRSGRTSRMILRPWGSKQTSLCRGQVRHATSCSACTHLLALSSSISCASFVVPVARLCARIIGVPLRPEPATLMSTAPWAHAPARDSSPLRQVPILKHWVREGAVRKQERLGSRRCIGSGSKLQPQSLSPGPWFMFCSKGEFSITIVLGATGRSGAS